MSNSSFVSSRTFPIVVSDLTPVGEEVMDHFRQQAYEVAGSRKAEGGWHISISKGGTFKSIVGLKTALNIDISPAPGGTYVSAGVGIFEMQAIPTVITILVFWPIVFAQIWGLVQQEELDDEALRVVENSLVLHSSEVYTS